MNYTDPTLRNVETERDSKEKEILTDVCRFWTLVVGTYAE